MKWVERYHKIEESREYITLDLFINFRGTRWNNSTSRKVLTLRYFVQSEDISYPNPNNKMLTYIVHKHKDMTVYFDGIIQHLDCYDARTSQRIFSQYEYDKFTLEYAKKLAVDYLKSHLQEIYIQLP